MSAVIQNEYTGNGSTTQYSFTFPYLKATDIKASLDAVETTAFTLPNATTLQFNTAPSNGAKIKIFRETGVDDLTATFYAGSAIKSEDLNDNFTQNLYKTQEVGARAISALGGTMTGNLTLDTQADLVFEGSTANDYETTIKVVDPTADRTITFPNVTGNVVTTGDTGTVATSMIANDAITNAKIADDQIDSEHYVDGSIDTAHIANAQVTTAKIADDAITSAKIADNAVNGNHIDNGSVSTAKIADSAVTSAKLASGAVLNSNLATDAVNSSNILDLAVNTSKINNNAVTLAKMADDSVGTAELVDGSVDTARLADNAVTLAKMADSSVGTSEIVDAAVTTVKLADNSVTMAKLSSGTLPTDITVASANLVDGTIATADIADNAITTAKIADAELSTLAGMQSGTASKLADSTALTADIADLNQIDGLTKQTTISDSDASFPTSGAVVDYVAAQIAPLGGLEVIATEVAFPNTQPQAGVVISISDAGGVVFNGSGTSTTGRTVGGSTVTINNAPSSLNSETLAAGVGLMVSSTGSGQIYNYHKILGKEDDIKQLSDDINDFNSRYRVGSSNPTSALDAGDLFFNTSTSKLLVYNATNSAWEEAQSIGNFFISTLSPAFDNSTQNFTITNAPTNAEQIILSINGVIQKPNAGTSTPSEGFALDGSTVKLAAAPPTGSTYFAVVVGSTVNIGQPSNNTVTTAVLQNSSVTTAKIADDAVTSAKIADGAIVNADVNASAAIAGTKVSPDFGSQNISTTGNIEIDSDSAELKLGDGQDFRLFHNGSDNRIIAQNGELLVQCNTYSIRNENGSATYATINSSGQVGIGTATPSANIESQGNVSSTTQFSGFQGLRIQNANGAAHGVTADLNFVAGTGSNNRGAVIGAEFTSAANGNDLYFATNPNSVSSNDTPIERMRISSSGNVSIEGANNTTFDHVSVLTLKGTDAYNSGNAGSGISFGGKFNSDGDITTLGQISCIKESTVSSEYDGALTFGTRSDASGEGVNIERMRLDSSGQLLLNETAAGGTCRLGMSFGNATGNYMELGGTQRVANGLSKIFVFRHGYWGGSKEVASIGVDTTSSTGGSGRGLGALVFHTGTSGNGDSASDSQQRLKITHGGDFLFNRSVNITGETYTFTSTSGNAMAIHQEENANVIGMYLRHGYAASGQNGKMLSFRRSDGTEVGSITIGNGSISVNGDSDYRLKENEVAISDGITRLKTLKPYKFNFKDDPDYKFDGFFAHEVSTAVPEAVQGVKDAVNEDGSIKAQQIDHTKLIPLLTAALKEAITKIETLETKVAALEAA